MKGKSSTLLRKTEGEGDDVIKFKLPMENKKVKITQHTEGTRRGDQERSEKRRRASGT